MDEPGFNSSGHLGDVRVAIVGLGLMGGSLALALRGRCAHLTGIDPDAGTLRLAAEKDVCDALFQQPGDGLAQADLIILAAPVGAILRLLVDLPQAAPGSPVVLDLGSTKAAVVQAMQALPPRFDPVGGHPMCGKETNGLAAADAAIFVGRPFVFTRLERTSERACQLAGELAQAIHAVPLWLDAETHDRWAAYTSHLPYLAACALASSVPPESAPLAGSGYASTTRVAATSPAMMRDVLLTNRENLLDGIKELRRQLEALEAGLRAQDPVLLEDLLDKAAAGRSALLAAHAAGGLA